MDYIEIGSSPTDEDCAQVGSENYPERARKECNAFRNQLLRTFPDIPTNTIIRVKSFEHDFGTYLEVICEYDENNEESTNYAFKLEAETPTHWDEQAKRELQENHSQQLKTK